MEERERRPEGRPVFMTSCQKRNSSLFQVVAVTVCGAVPLATVPVCRLSLKALCLGKIRLLFVVNCVSPIDTRGDHDIMNNSTHNCDL